ncbi:hypothetical protein [Actinomadura rupiterrae]|uniref:hypothetical protein n=1 Tax=Actinomadura rupiterrae TaxID=559627 RepID=UPI0020A30673|nr:hypothetical protein [Actinomadura rupiterrae]MCP2336370.1 hypothetical protein [Actinomadura rupiterrae]
MDWWSIEVFNGEQAARSWRDAWQDMLTESALTHGALGWLWDVTPWGVVFEICFPDEKDWLIWRELPGVRAALDAVPDPVNGLVVYRGRGGSSGSPLPRRPRPAPSAAAAALDEPPAEPVFDLTSVMPETTPTPLVTPGVPAGLPA